MTLILALALQIYLLDNVGGYLLDANGGRLTASDVPTPAQISATIVSPVKGQVLRGGNLNVAATASRAANIALVIDGSVIANCPLTIACSGAWQSKTKMQTHTISARAGNATTSITVQK